MKSFRLALLSLGLLTLVADQATKLWAAAHHLGSENRETSARVSPLSSAPCDGPCLRVGYSEAASVWPPLSAPVSERVKQGFTLVASALALGFLIFMLMQLRQEQRGLGVGLALVLGGALGNFADRLVRGCVVDIFQLHWQGHTGLRWQTFNFADAATGLGVALVLVSLFSAHASDGVALPSPHPWRPGAIGPHP